MIDWKALILTFLGLFLIGNILVFQSDGLNFAAALGLTLGTMVFPLLVAVLPAWFLGRRKAALLDWKVFAVTYLIVSFVSQVGILRNAGVDAVAAISQTAGGMITTLAIAILVGWISARRRASKTEPPRSEAETVD